MICLSMKVDSVDLICYSHVKKNKDFSRRKPPIFLLNPAMLFNIWRQFWIQKIPSMQPRILSNEGNGKLTI